MKAVIIGGGIAGLTFSIIMKKKGHEVVINERCNEIPHGANAFMMHEEGVMILKSILAESDMIPGIEINSFILKNPADHEMKSTEMENWKCMKRRDLVEAFKNNIDKNTIKYQRTFSHFKYDNNKVVAAVFENGDVEYGDIFIGADGSNSKVRDLLFGKTNFTKVEVQEVLGTVNDKELVKQLKGTFTKYQHQEKGISFGFIPCSESELIWFNQIDSNLISQPLTDTDSIQRFTKEILNNFPPIVQTILDKTNFANTYVWNTKDFDPLESFHYKNVVLMGDAAHLALPFTSAGTTNAMIDAVVLAEQIENETYIEKAFAGFYQARINTLKEHLDFGRKLKQHFLNPRENEEKFDIPLIKKKVNEDSDKKKIEIIYFTDPICSTCWTIQPQIKKLTTTFNKEIIFKYVMSGLLPSWENFNRGGIQKPEDVILHWDEASTETGIPINHSVWENDPIQSSYPPSIAFKAAQIQDQEKAVHFLRKLNELVFIKGINISRPSVIEMTAIESGLDTEKLMRDLKETALKLFYDDLAFSNEMNIVTLPTFAFKVEGIYKDFLYGYQPYEKFENIILKHYPRILKNPLPQTAADFFNLHSVVTKNEFSHKTESNNKKTEMIIQELIGNKSIHQNKLNGETIFYSIAV